VFIHKIIAGLALPVICWAQSPGLDGISVTGELKHDGVVLLGGYYVELFNEQDHSVADRVAVTNDGRFEFHHLTPGMYTVRLVTGPHEDPIVEEYHHIDNMTSQLELQLPMNRTARPGGKVSIQELAHPVPTKALQAFAEAQRHADDPVRAIAKLEEVIRIAPQYRNAHGNIGVQYGRVHRFADAISEFEKTIEIGPADSATYSNLSWAHASMQHFVEAEDAARKAIALEPGNEKARFLLGYAMAMQLGKETEALRNLDQVASAIPGAGKLSAELHRRIAQQ